jgi:transcriptional regulator with XRE-family HTH domain
MPMPPSSLGRKLRELRKAKGLSLEELATLTASSKSYIWELENKPVARPSGEKISKISAVLDVTPEFMLDESQTEATLSEHDRAFFRKYQGATQDVKNKIAGILKLLDD